jgi:hypothetical protein
MSHIIRRYNSRFRSKAGRRSWKFEARQAPGARVPGTPLARRGPENGAQTGSNYGSLPSSTGYALLLLMMTITLLLVSLTAALPSVTMEAQREREEELIFRGNEYMRAIALFHSRFARYPSSVDELLKKTNGFRFLRRAYRDPMTKSGKWRFIHVNAAGVPTDSKSMNLQAGMGVAMGNSPMGGNGTSSFGNGQSGTGSFGFGQIGSSNSPLGGASGVGTTSAQSGSQGSAMSGSQASSTSGPANGAATSADQTETGAGGETDTQAGGGTQQSTGFMSSNQTGGAFIVGVASRSKKHSIRIWNGKSHYDEWEFIGTGANPGGMQLMASPGGTGPGTGQPVGGQTGGVGGTGQSVIQSGPSSGSQPQAPVAQPTPPQPEPMPPETPVEPQPPDSAEPQQ